nr:MFS transporter [Amycolatopsis sp. 195334CR]
MTAGTERSGVRELLAPPGFRRLLLSRFASQWGDGVYQAGLAGAVLFNPERAADALTIAGGFAALLLPYSVLGPFAGALLDRWDRRQVLVVANLLRAVAIGMSALSVGLGTEGVPLFALALVVMGISRFAGCGLSASLPHVVPPAKLVGANALATTLGSIVAVLGGGCAIALRAVLGQDDVGSAWTTACAIAGSLVAAVIAARFARGELGPSTVDEPAVAVLAVARGLADGARAVLRTPSVRAGFLGLFAHRVGFGISLLLTVLLMRFSFTDHGLLRAGLTGLGQLALLAGAGLLLGGLVTPRLVARFGPRRVITAGLLLAAASLAGLGLPLVLPTVLLASFTLAVAGQLVKLCVDAAIQQDVGDEVRGRVFACYDALFTITQVAAVVVTALVAPLDGRAPGVLLVATAVYGVGALGYLAVTRSSIRTSE